VDKHLSRKGHAMIEGNREDRIRVLEKMMASLESQMATLREELQAIANAPAASPEEPKLPPIPAEVYETSAPEEPVAEPVVHSKPPAPVEPVTEPEPPTPVEPEIPDQVEPEIVAESQPEPKRDLTPVAAPEETVEETPTQRAEKVLDDLSAAWPDRKESAPSTPEPKTEPVAPVVEPVKSPAPSVVPERAAVSVEPKPARQKRSFEQMLGTKWLNWVGVILVLLGAGAFLQYAASQGWINPALRVFAVAAGGVVLLGAGEWARRRNMSGFGASLTGGGIALLYAAVFAASPSFYGLIPMWMGFALMCCVSAVGVGLALACGYRSMGVLAQVGVYLTPILMATDVASLSGLMIYLIVAAGGFLVISRLRGWVELPLIAFAGSAALMTTWAVVHYAPTDFATLLGFSWVLALEFFAHGVYSHLRKSKPDHLAEVLVGLTGIAMGVLIYCASWSGSWASVPTLIHWIALTSVLVGIVLWCRWDQMLLPVVLTATIASLLWYLPVEARMLGILLGLFWVQFAIVTGVPLIGAVTGRLKDESVCTATAITTSVLGLQILLHGFQMGTPAWGVVASSGLVHWIVLVFIVLMISTWRRWTVLASVIAAGAGAYSLFWLMGGQHQTDATLRTILFWVQFGVIASLPTAGVILGRFDEVAMKVGVLAGGLALGMQCVVLAFQTAIPIGETASLSMLVHWIVLMGILQGVAVWRGWSEWVSPIGVLTVGAAVWLVGPQHCTSLSLRLGLFWVLFGVSVGIPLLGAALRRVNDVGVCGALMVSGVLMGTVCVVQAFNTGDPVGRIAELGMLIHWIVLTCILLVIVLWRRWDRLVLPVSLVAGLCSMLWLIGSRYQTQPGLRMVLYWILFAITMGVPVVGAAIGRLKEWSAQVATMVAGTVLTVESLVRGTPDLIPLWHVASVAVVVLGVGLWRRWPWTRLVALGWSALAGAVMYVSVGQSLDNVTTWLVWSWGMYVLYTGDVLARAYNPNCTDDRRIGTTMSAAALAGMYLLTRRALGLEGMWESWQVAIYSAGLGVVLIAIAVHLRYVTERRVLSSNYLAQGLVLLALAVPLAFDYAAVPVVWTAQAVASMFLAYRLREKLLALKAPVVLIAAGVYLYGWELPRLAAHGAILTIAGVGYTELLLLMWSWSIGVVAVAVGMSMSRKHWSVLHRAGIWQLTLIGGFLAWTVWTLRELPVHSATWFLLAIPLVSRLWFGRSREKLLIVLAYIALAGCVGKYCFYDTFVTDYPGVVPVLNTYALLGLVLAGMCYLVERYGPEHLGGGWLIRKGLPVLAVLAGAFTVFWSGCAEIVRWFGGPTQVADQATQVGLSLWWAIWASILLVWGFGSRHALRRYLALGLFVVTVGKVLALDMLGVETVYRVLSLVASGVLLIGASWVYQRYSKRILEMVVSNDDDAQTPVEVPME
jgi:hypothetical protein